MTVASFPAPDQVPHRFPDPIPGIIHFSSLNILAGASGVGKTCLTSWLLRQLKDGQPVFNRQTNAPTQIALFSADRGADTTYYWLNKVGLGDPEALTFYSIAEDANFATTTLRNKLKLVQTFDTCLEKMALLPGALLVVDPIALFLGNLGDYHGIAVACLELRRICKRRQLTMIGLAHAAKQKADKKERYQRLQDRINGSGAQLGYGDTQMYLAAPEETGERHYTFLWHPHTAPAETFRLGRNEEGLFVPWEHSQEAEHTNAIFDVIPPDGSNIPLATILGLCSDVSRATVFRRLNELLEDGLIEKPLEGQYRRCRVN